MTSASNPSAAVPVAVVGDRCGEGAVWSPDEQAVYWTDINRFLVHRLTWPSCALTTWVFGEPATAMALSTDPGRLLIALASKLIWWWPESDRREDHGFRLPGHPKVRFNDGRPDPAGNFWVGSMYNNVAAHGGATDEHRATGNGVLFRVTPGGDATEEVRGIGISNTACWSPDGSRFYSADTMKNEIRAYEFDPSTGRLGQARSYFAGFERGSPDGSSVDSAGYLWNCRWGGGGIARIAPDGRLDSFHPLPTANVTTCVFGGQDLTTLFITSARNDPDPGDRLAGSLWAMPAPVPGLPPARVGVV